MVQRLELAAAISLVASVLFATLLFAAFLVRAAHAQWTGAPIPGRPEWADTTLLVAFCVAGAFQLLLVVGRCLAAFVEAYHEGRAIFVRRILAPREEALLERIARLERALARTADRDGVLHARGLEITDAEGAPILVAAKDEHGVTRVTVGGEAGGTAASIFVKERGCGFEMRDEAGRLRIRTAVHRGDAWLTVFDAKEEPRAGFLVTADGPRLLLDRTASPRAGGGAATPGYL